MKKMQEEIECFAIFNPYADSHLLLSSLLLEALMPTTPPAPSTSLDRSEPGMYYNRTHGMDVEMEVQRELPVLLPTPLAPILPTHHENSRSRLPQTNGKTNGSTTNGAHPYSVEVSRSVVHLSRLADCFL